MTRQELDMIQSFLLESVETIEFPGSDATLRYIPYDAIFKLSEARDDRDYAQKVRISDDYSLDDLVTLLSDGLAAECGFCGVDYSRDDYVAARESLLDKGVSENSLCRELVQAEMILIGKSFWLIESEINERHLVTIEKVVKGLDMSVESLMKELGCTRMHAICKLFEDGDFYTFNDVLQNAIFGEIVYG